MFKSFLVKTETIKLNHSWFNSSFEHEKKYAQVLWNIQILTRENVVELLTVWVLFCDFYGCSSMVILWKGTWWMEMLYCSTDNPHCTNLASWLTRLVQWSIHYFSVPFHYKLKFVGYKNLQCDHLRRNVLIENKLLILNY